MEDDDDDEPMATDCDVEYGWLRCCRVDAATATPDAFFVDYPAPLVYWGFNSDNVNGTTLNATVGSLPGTLMSPTLDSNGQVGEALSFDGIDDFVGFGDVLDNVFAGADKRFSIALWVRPTTITGERHLLTKFSGPTQCGEEQRQLVLDLVDGKPTFYFLSVTGEIQGQLIGSSTAVAEDAWSHIAVTYDGSIDSAGIDRVHMYVNGIELQPLTILGEVGSFPFDISNGNAHLSFGAFISSTGEPCNTDYFRGLWTRLPSGIAC